MDIFETAPVFWACVHIGLGLAILFLIVACTIGLIRDVNALEEEQDDDPTNS